MGDYIHVNDPYERGEGAGDLFRGERHLSAAQQPIQNPYPKNENGYISGKPAYTLPGGPILLNSNGVWGAFPIRSINVNGGAMQPPMANPTGYIYRDTLLYRSDTTPRRDGPFYRTLPSSPTTPVSAYRFLNGRQGQVYG